MVYVGSSAKDVTFPLIRRPSVKYVPDWFPGAEFKRRAKEGYGIARDMLNKPYDLAKQRYVSLQCHPSFAARLKILVSIAGRKRLSLRGIKAHTG